MLGAAHVGVKINPDLHLGKPSKTTPLALGANHIEIADFRDITSLLFDHGFYSMQQRTIFVKFLLHKGALLALCEVYFQLFNGFSSKMFFGFPWLFYLFDLLLTAIPGLIIVLSEGKRNGSTSQAHPVDVYPSQYRMNKEDLRSGNWTQGMVFSLLLALFQTTVIMTVALFGFNTFT